MFNATEATEWPDLDSIADDLRTLAAVVAVREQRTSDPAEPEALDVAKVLLNLAAAVQSWHECVS